MNSNGSQGEAITDEEASARLFRLAINDIYYQSIEPAIATGAIRISPRLVMMMQETIQFGGSIPDDPRKHIRKFEEFIDTLELNGNSKDDVKFRFSPFSLRARAKFWFNSLPSRSITKWEELEQHFLDKFHPLVRASILRNMTPQFAQYPRESLFGAWERFMTMWEKLPADGMPAGMAIHYFYRGLEGRFRFVLDAAAGGYLWDKSFEEAYELLEELTETEFEDQQSRQSAYSLTERDSA